MNSETRLYPIQNPTDKITQFRFDGGWKAVAETDIENPTKPEPGMSVLLPNGTTAKIMEVSAWRRRAYSARDPATGWMPATQGLRTRQDEVVP